jgi:hypothetical protein
MELNGKINLKRSALLLLGFKYSLMDFIDRSLIYLSEAMQEPPLVRLRLVALPITAPDQIRQPPSSPL